MFNRIILPDDTLESIAREINLEKPEFILQFHNSKCAKEDLIKDKLIPWKKLHIPGKELVEKVNVEVFEELSKPQYNPNIKFFPSSIDGSFRTIILESAVNANNKKEIVKIIYDAQLKYNENQNGLHVIEYSRNKFKGTHEGMLSDLALKCFEKICPLLIFLNENGVVVRIEIKKEIKADFDKIKKEIADYFIGEIADSYLENFEYVVKNDALFNKKMKKDLFIRTYFAPVRKKFEHGKSTVKLTFAEKEEWQIEQKVEENTEEKLKISQCLGKISFPEDENFTNYEGQYLFNPQTFLIEECNAIFQQKFRLLEKEIKINIKKV